MDTTLQLPTPKFSTRGKSIAKASRSQLRDGKTTTRGILCGTDFSSRAREAATAAAVIAKRLKEPLTLVHVLDNSPVGDLPRYWPEPVRDLHRRQLKGEAERLRRMGAEVVEEFMDGRLDTTLVEFARKTGARLVVVSTHDHPAPARWIMGSVAEWTAESAPVPTMVVRDAAPFEAWARGERALRVLVGVDFTSVSDEALYWVKDVLRKLGRCEVTLLFIEWMSGEMDRTGLDVFSNAIAPIAQTHHVLKRDLQEKARRILGDENVRVRIEPHWGSTSHHLAEDAGTEHPDLIVVGTHQRHGLSHWLHGSVSRGVLHEAKTNVVCVPAVERAKSRRTRAATIKRVLMALDLSEHGGWAVPYAYSVVQAGGRVCLFHVLKPDKLLQRRAAQFDPQGVFKQEHALAVHEAAQKLRGMIPKDAEKRGIRTEVEVIEHPSADTAICQAAERFSADLICLGSPCRSRLTRKLMGSTAQSVFTKTTRPVLIVREPPP